MKNRIISRGVFFVRFSAIIIHFPRKLNRFCSLALSSLFRSVCKLSLDIPLRYDVFLLTASPILFRGRTRYTQEVTRYMKKINPSFLGPALIILAGIFWGSMGIFVRRLSSFGFAPIQITSIRLTLAAVGFCLIQLICVPAGFHISIRDLPLFLGLGVGSVLFFSSCYFTAINMMSLSTAAILLYTSPIWIMLMSVLFFHEKLTGKKLLALALAFGGCVLVSGISGGGLTLPGLLVGLGSGIGYGPYSILGTVALRRYSPYTVTTWTFLFAAIGSWFISHPAEIIAKFSSTPSPLGLFLFCCLTALVTAVVPFLTYTLGLRTVEASRAGILATIEPMVATLIGVFVFSEPLTLFSGLGVLLILAAVILLNLKQKERTLYEN